MWQIYLNYHQRMGILPLKKRVNRDKCIFATKQRMFGVFAIDEFLRYRWTRFVGLRTLCHPAPSSFRLFIKIGPRKFSMFTLSVTCHSSLLAWLPVTFMEKFTSPLLLCGDGQHEALGSLDFSIGITRFCLKMNKKIFTFKHFFFLIFIA